MIDNLDRARAAWDGFQIASACGWWTESQECLKEHFRFVDEAAKEQRPDLYAAETTEQKK